MSPDLPAPLRVAAERLLEGVSRKGTLSKNSSGSSFSYSRRAAVVVMRAL